MMHAIDKLDQDVTLKVPAKYVATLVKALEDGALVHLAELADDEELPERERAFHLSILVCYREVHRVLAKVNDELFTKDDISTLSKAAYATLDGMTGATKGSVN